MALILLSSRSMTRSGIKALTLRQVLLGAGVACAVVGVAAFALGMSVGRLLESEQQQTLASADKPDPTRERFAFERLGELSGRVLSLESNASSLIKKIAALDSLEKKLGAMQPGPSYRVDSVRGGARSGGQALAPRCEYAQLQQAGGSPGEQVERAERAVDCLQKILTEVENAATARSVAYMAVPTRAPVDSQELGSAFGNRTDPITGRLAFHSGLDFPADVGTPIHAAGGGKVRFAGWHNELGNVVEIEHGNGLLTRYAHASRLLVKNGEVVTPRQQIAAVGSTGRSTGPHLHFEVIHDGRYVDPQRYLQVGGG